MLEQFNSNRRLSKDSLTETLEGTLSSDSEHRPVVLKRLTAPAADNSALVHCFLQTGERIRDLWFQLDEQTRPLGPTTLRRAGLAAILEVGNDPAWGPAILVRWPRGTLLAERLAKKSPLGPEKEVLRLAQQIALTLAAAHCQEIYHGTLHPKNVLFPAPEPSQTLQTVGVLLLNFGMAYLEAEHHRLTGVLGALSPSERAYRAPELLRDPNCLSGASDVYSLGGLLGRMLLGTVPPYEPAALQSLRPSVAALVMSMLTQSPEERPEMEEVAVQLGRLIKESEDLVLEKTLGGGRDWTLHAAFSGSSAQRGLLRILQLDTSYLRAQYFQSCAQRVRAAQVPGLAPILAVDQLADGRSYVLSDSPGDHTLANRLSQGALPTSETLQVGLGIARALQGLHERGLLYLDLFPDRVVMVSRPSGGMQRTAQLWLLESDQILVDPPLHPLPSLEERPAPTPSQYPYLAPEQKRPTPGSELCDRTDAFALGSLLLHMLDGHPPADSSIGQRVTLGDEHLPRPFAEMLAELLTSMRGERPVERPRMDEIIRRLSWLSQISVILEGEPIGGKFRVIEQLETGGMALVFRAVHQELGKQVVIKIPLPGMQHERCRQEALAAVLAKRVHPDIVEVLEFGMLADGSTPYIAMEFVPGVSLSTRLRELGRPLAERHAARIAANIAQAMAAAHSEGVVHRDLKPGNIMLVPDPQLPEGGRVKILDFGIAKVKPQQRPGGKPLTQMGMAFGTPGYMSLEQRMDSATVDGKADVYSLGAILIELLTGAAPLQFITDPQKLDQALRPVASRRIRSVISRMTAAEAVNRPDMPEVANELLRIVEAPPRLWYAALLLFILAVSGGSVLSYRAIQGERAAAAVPDQSELQDLGATAAQESPAKALTPVPDAAVGDLAARAHEHQENPDLAVRALPHPSPNPEQPHCRQVTRDCVQGAKDETQSQIYKALRSAEVALCRGEHFSLVKSGPEQLGSMHTRMMVDTRGFAISPKRLARLESALFALLQGQPLPDEVMVQCR